ncbi:MAG: hypothetical protein CO137_00035 [Candidatus Magasanikbacteria bacterium CG_4_9_14_3_um_filter_32_9]|uniref:Uncharacterized protein n=1 Tax=Candidatus Magasanikbacteria bacterium CG_4_9_14_3_um_filter_32_9 TaxID=1974644 RepID=A0A2M7Z7W4_9BACT|nr:MAG: hypothetical protein CO137_00035 [Candidatus Magasanikbacteria bacterium CG_4_9_14_3_um_filter_32_9]
MNFFFLQKDNQRTKRLTFVIISIFIVTLADFLFIKQLPGINVFIVTFAYLFGFSAVALATKHVQNKKFFLLTIPILLLSLSSALYSNLLVQSVGLLVLSISLILYGLLLTLKNPDRHPIIFKNIPTITNIFDPLFKVKVLFTDIFVWEKGKKAQKIIRKILLGLGISLPILAIFTLLLLNADAVFKDFFINLTDNFVDFTIFDRIIRIVIGTVIIGTLWYVFIDQAHKLNHREANIKKFDSIVLGIILGSVNALFVAFVFIQIKYLFAGSPLDLDLTYAEYAKHGFFELVWVVLLSAVLHLIVFRSTSKHKTPILIKIFQVSLISQVGIIAYSALMRMNMYQEAYGYTVKRLYVEWFIYVIIGLLLFSGIALFAKLSFQKFFSRSLLLVFCAFVSVSLINVDYLIAKENVRRVIQDGESLDIMYLSTLSPDVVPALLPLFKDKELVTKVNTDYLKKVSGKVRIHSLEELISFYIRDIEKRNSWPSWYYGKKNLQEVKDVFDLRIKLLLEEQEKIQENI